MKTPSPLAARLFRSPPPPWLLLVIVALFLSVRPASAQYGYTYFYWGNISSEVRFNPDADYGNPDFVEIDYGCGYVPTNYTIDETYGFDFSQPAVAGDDWELVTIGGVDYEHDTTYFGYWWVDSGYISAIGMEGYTLLSFPPTADLIYYWNDYAYDTVNDQWYDEELIDPYTHDWQFTSFSPDPAYIIGGANWEPHAINSQDYAYDTVTGQWYIDDGYNSEIGEDTWSTCEDPE